jgi:hypothetical protein
MNDYARDTLLCMVSTGTGFYYSLSHFSDFDAKIRTVYIFVIADV